MATQIFFKENFSLLPMEDNCVTLQLPRIAIIHGTPFLLGSLEAPVAQEKEEGVRGELTAVRTKRSNCLRSEDCSRKACGPK